MHPTRTPSAAELKKSAGDDELRIEERDRLGLAIHILIEKDHIIPGIVRGNGGENLIADLDRASLAENRRITVALVKKIMSGEEINASN